MATGFLSAGKCWETAQQAIDAFYAHSPQPFMLSNSSNFYVSIFQKIDGQWKHTYAHQSSSGFTVSGWVAPTNVYGSCTYEVAGVEYNYEAAIAAWGFGFMTVVGLWLLAKHFGVILDFIRRA